MAGLGHLRVESVAVIGNDQLGRTAALVEKARGRLRHWMNAGRKGPALGSNRLALLVEIGLVVVLGLAVGRILLTFTAPLPVAEDPPPPRPAASAPADVGNPFRMVAVLEPEATAEIALEAADTTLDLALHGTWVESEGGTAIIRTPDGEQKMFSVGEAICCGATLERIYADRVTILRSGARETLRLADKEHSAALGQAAPAAADSAPSERTAPDLRQLVRIQPSRDLGEGFQLQLYPAIDAALFERMGLRPGDVLVSINDRPAPTSITGLAELMETLEGATSARVIVTRSGVEATVDVSVKPDVQLVNQ